MEERRTYSLHFPEPQTEREPSLESKWSPVERRQGELGQRGPRRQQGPGRPRTARSAACSQGEATQTLVSHPPPLNFDSQCQVSSGLVYTPL